MDDESHTSRPESIRRLPRGAADPAHVHRSRRASCLPGVAELPPPVGYPETCHAQKSRRDTALHGVAELPPPGSLREDTVESAHQSTQLPGAHQLPPPSSSLGHQVLPAPALHVQRSNVKATRTFYLDGQSASCSASCSSERQSSHLPDSDRCEGLVPTEEHAAGTSPAIGEAGDAQDVSRGVVLRSKHHHKSTKTFRFHDATTASPPVGSSGGISSAQAPNPESAAVTAALCAVAADVFAAATDTAVSAAASAADEVADAADAVHAGDAAAPAASSGFRASVFAREAIGLGLKSLDPPTDAADNAAEPHEGAPAAGRPTTLRMLGVAAKIVARGQLEATRHLREQCRASRGSMRGSKALPAVPLPPQMESAHACPSSGHSAAAGTPGTRSNAKAAKMFGVQEWVVDQQRSQQGPTTAEAAPLDDPAASPRALAPSARKERQRSCMVPVEGDCGLSRERPESCRQQQRRAPGLASVEEATVDHVEGAVSAEGGGAQLVIKSSAKSKATFYLDGPTKNQDAMETVAASSAHSAAAGTPGTRSNAKAAKMFGVHEWVVDQQKSQQDPTTAEAAPLDDPAASPRVLAPSARKERQR